MVRLVTILTPVPSTPRLELRDRLQRPPKLLHIRLRVKAGAANSAAAPASELLIFIGLPQSAGAPTGGWQDGTIDRAGPANLEDTSASELRNARYN